MYHTVLLGISLEKTAALLSRLDCVLTSYLYPFTPSFRFFSIAMDDTSGTAHDNGGPTRTSLSSSLPRRTAAAVALLLVCLVVFLATAAKMESTTNTDSVRSVGATLLQHQRRRFLRHKPHLSSTAAFPSFFCRDVLPPIHHSDNEPDSPITTSRRTTTSTSQQARPFLAAWVEKSDERSSSWAITESDALERLDQILQKDAIYNKDLVVEVVSTVDDDETVGSTEEDAGTGAAAGLTSKYASSFGWPVVALSADGFGQVHSVCESSSYSSSSTAPIDPLKTVEKPDWATSNPANHPLTLDGAIDPSVLTRTAAAVSSSSSSPRVRVRLLHVNTRRGTGAVVRGVSRLLHEGRVDHVVVGLRYGTSTSERDAAEAVQSLLDAGYLPTDDKDRKQRHHGDAWRTGDAAHDATEFLRHLVSSDRSTTYRQVWFYRDATVVPKSDVTDLGADQN